MAEIFGINGPVIKAKNADELMMLEKVYVGNIGLVGEVIKTNGDTVTIQVYEDTDGIKIGEKVSGTGSPLSLLLGPGLMGNIFDGILRPLPVLAQMSGDFIKRGMETSSIDIKKQWECNILVKEGDFLASGSVFATVNETDVIIHKALIPPDVKGTVLNVIEKSAYTVTEPILILKCPNGEEKEISLAQKWPIRRPRPLSKRTISDKMLFTGQRIIDTFFPIVKGGAAAIPGGFGTGKTMTQHQLAKWSDADIIVYIGCGERGNEMTQVLDEFSELIDPRTKRPLNDRTILIANTSNMPVAAREASIYTGITLAEYYRDMGYDVAIMADSTSRWAEALREISGRLEEMPAEEGFPAYLSSRLSEFYERAGNGVTLNGDTASVTIIGAVSPQGGDFSEPVTQNTMRYIRCFWALDKNLAYVRHYPAINWLTSYSEYVTYLTDYYAQNAGEDFLSMKDEMVALLSEESSLMDIVKLVGSDILPDGQKLILEIARVVKSGYLSQNAYDSVDTYVTMKKQYIMLSLMLYYYKCAKEKIDNGATYEQVLSLNLSEDLMRMKFEIKNDELDKFDIIREKITDAFSKELNGTV